MTLSRPCHSVYGGPHTGVALLRSAGCRLVERVQGATGHDAGVGRRVGFGKVDGPGRRVDQGVEEPRMRDEHLGGVGGHQVEGHGDGLVADAGVFASVRSIAQYVEQRPASRRAQAALVGRRDVRHVAQRAQRQQARLEEPGADVAGGAAPAPWHEPRPCHVPDGVQEVLPLGHLNLVLLFAGEVQKKSESGVLQRQRSGTDGPRIAPLTWSVRDLYHDVQETRLIGHTRHVFVAARHIGQGPESVVAS